MLTTALALLMLAATPVRTPTHAPAPPGGAPSRIGINIGYANDWATERQYADLVKVARHLADPDSFRDISGTPRVDADGWPRVDFMLGLVYGLDRLHGTYRLVFTGQASSIRLHLTSGTVTNKIYDPVSNVTRADVTIAASEHANTAFRLVFRGTKRRPTDAPGTGVTNIRLQRPQAPGSTTPFPEDRLFAFRNADGSWTSYATLLRKFEVLRFMDFTFTNHNQESSWSDRTLPRRWSVSGAAVGNQLGGASIGVPWEHVVLFANDVFSDAQARERGIWINVPHKATDAYVLALARLMRYGSDGVNPYTAPQAKPVFPPLDPSIKLYVEYSNELWNGIFSQAAWNLSAAKAEVAAYPSRMGPLSYDREAFSPGDEWSLDLRRAVKRTVEISNIFRSVFGDAAMMTRVRPVLGGQAVNISTLQQPAGYLFNLWNDGDGTHFGAGGDFAPGGAYHATLGPWTAAPDGRPHPPGYFIYGMGGTTYFTPSDITTTRAALTTGMMAIEPWLAQQQRYSSRAARAIGLERTAYEGGPDHNDQSQVWFDATQVKRPVAPNMTDQLVAHQRAYDSVGGDLNVMYVAGHDKRWSFLPFTGEGGRGDVFRLDSAKLLAVDEINATARAPVTYGTAIPGTATAFDWGWTVGWYDMTNTLGDANGKTRWLAYLFRADEALPGSTITLSKRGAGIARVYVDGAAATATRGDTVWSGGPLGAGLHGVIVRASSGSFTLDGVTVRR